MRKILMVVLFVFVLSASSHAQWEIQHTNTEYTLRPVFFTDANTGFVVGNIRTGSDFKSTLLKTEDTGATWVTVLKSDTLRLRDVFFTSTKTGYLIASSAKREVLLKTIDGGLTWKNQPTTYVNNRSFARIHFTSPESGIITGAYGMLMQTTDAGAHWTKLPVAPMPLFDWVFRGQVGYAIGRAPTMGVEGKNRFAVAKTTDGGASWSVLESSLSTDGYSSLAFPTPDIGYVWSSARDANDKTDYSYLCKTTDGGASWTKMKIRNMFKGLLYFTDASTGYNVTTDSIHKTVDGGKTWRARVINVNPRDDKYRLSRDTHAIAFPTPNTCIATIYSESQARKNMIIRLNYAKPQAKKGDVTK